MKNILIGSFMAVALFAAPVYPAQAQTASTTEEMIASIRIELINLMLQLIAELQSQLDAQTAKDVVQDEEIAVIKRSSGGSSTQTVQDTAVVEAPVDTLALARSKVGQIEATASVGEDRIYFSVTDYLDADTVNFDANRVASSTEDGCNAIAGTEYQVCGQSAEWGVLTEDLVIDVTVNGVQKTLMLEPGERGIVRVTWPN